MDVASNPYAPGAGTPPPFMAGREAIVSEAEIALGRAKAGRSARSFIAVGLRGVGKTVILNRIQDLADAGGYQSVFIEAREKDSFVTLLVPALTKILLRLDRIRNAKEKARRALRVAKSFATAFRASYAGFEIGVDTGEENGVADSGDLAADLPELLIAIGEAARAADTAIVVLIDEIQYLPIGELGALIASLHRIAQKSLPIVLVGAGLPQVLGRMGDAKSYAERLFDFPRVAELPEEDAFRAIAEPAREVEVAFTDEALAEIYRVTRGYPYFLQEWGFVTWNLAEASPIGIDVVRAANEEATRRLDASFFRVRLERMNPTERRYMRAMAELGPGPHRSGDIARVYGTAVTTAAPIRSSLISQGMIYSPAHGDTEFTVPMFDAFLRREIPGLERRAR